MTKYSFEIKTRDGHKIPAIQIAGQDLFDAENKLRRMYRNCEITNTKELSQASKPILINDFENLLDLISH